MAKGQIVSSFIVFCIALYIIWGIMFEAAFWVFSGSFFNPMDFTLMPSRFAIIMGVVSGIIISLVFWNPR